jgi:hypothetical protein
MRRPPDQEHAMFPMPLRIPRRWKVLFWRLGDRLRKPLAAPLPVAAADDRRLDKPAYLRRGERPNADTASRPGESSC